MKVLIHFLGCRSQPKTGNTIERRAVGSNRTLSNSGNSLRISVYKLGFLVGKGYLCSGLPQFIFYLLTVMMKIHSKAMAKLAGLQLQVFLSFLKCLLVKIDLMEASTSTKEVEAS